MEDGRVPVLATDRRRVGRVGHGAKIRQGSAAVEALAVAFPLGLVLLTTLGLVQRAVELNFQDWSYIEEIFFPE